MDPYSVIQKLLRNSHESECLELKEAKENFDFSKLGKYFSALCNEANLNQQAYAWLVFGVTDDRRIVGTSYRNNAVLLDKLKHEISEKTTGSITFVQIFELTFPEGRVLLFQIPAAPRGIPVAWDGHYYGRNGSSLVALNIKEIEQIRSANVHIDWSATICSTATIDDLDERAILKARLEYKNKFPKLAEDVDLWDNVTFLNKSKILIQGKVTNAAIVLLGKEDSVHFIQPSVAQMTWILKDEHGTEKDYEHFGPPFLLNSERLFAKIRNLKYRYLPNQSLFPIEVDQYDAYVIREALHNCIAHQDYELNGRISVVEKPDELIFSNLGRFIPGTVQAVIENDSPPAFYRNKLLVDAMVHFNMIDTIGSGIKRMFLTQRKRSFPMPDYDFSRTDDIRLRINCYVIGSCPKTNVNFIHRSKAIKKARAS